MQVFGLKGVKNGYKVKKGYTFGAGYTFSALTLKQRKTKSLPIFMKVLQLVRRGTLSSELSQCLRYLYPFKSYGKCLVFRFF